MVTKNLMKSSKNPISLEFRAPCINGQTDSYQDSTEFNSRNHIDSFNHMTASPSPKHKKKSIYKATLQKTGGGPMIGVKPVASEFDSFYSNNGSNASSREEMDNDPAKGSRSVDRRPVPHQQSGDDSDDGEVAENERFQHKRSKFGRDS